MKSKYLLASVFVLACLLTGCVTVFVPVDTPTPAPTAIIVATLPPPTRTPVASPTQFQFAQTCSADPLAEVCSRPSVGILSKSCIKKVPYVLLGLTPGSTFEVVSPGMTCKDEKVHGGVQQVSCTGQQLYSYELKVCDTACSTLQLETDTDQCPHGYGYSAAAGCCWPTSVLEAGCVIYKVDIGACP